eukprot:4081289-Alexandrium_andersonii.AAC.1
MASSNWQHAGKKAGGGSERRPTALSRPLAGIATVCSNTRRTDCTQARQKTVAAETAAAIGVARARG